MHTGWTSHHPEEDHKSRVILHHHAGCPKKNDTVTLRHNFRLNNSNYNFKWGCNINLISNIMQKTAIDSVE